MGRLLGLGDFLLLLFGAPCLNTLADGQAPRMLSEVNSTARVFESLNTLADGQAPRIFVSIQFKSPSGRVSIPSLMGRLLGSAGVFCEAAFCVVSIPSLMGRLLGLAEVLGAIVYGFGLNTLADGQAPRMPWRGWGYFGLCQSQYPR